jgi:6-hydroxytryprostatin B O-methyltransferase
LDELTRTVRYAITNGIFTEYTPGLFAHSAASAALARNKHLRDICDFNTDFLAAIQIKLAEALKARASGASDAPHAAFNVAYRTKDDLFQHFHKDADLNAKYHGYLAGRVNTPLWSVDRLLTAWDWSALGDATVVDVCIPTSPLRFLYLYVISSFSNFQSESSMAWGTFISVLTGPRC